MGYWARVARRTAIYTVALAVIVAGGAGIAWMIANVPPRLLLVLVAALLIALAMRREA